MDHRACIRAWQFFRAASEIGGVNAVAGRMVGLGGSHCGGLPGFIATPLYPDNSRPSIHKIQVIYRKISQFGGEIPQNIPLNKRSAMIQNQTFFFKKRPIILLALRYTIY
jgi:hypothetical protein